MRIGEVGGGITAGRFGVRISPPAFLVQFARSACACVGVLYSHGPKVFVRCIDQSEFTVGVGRLSHLDSFDVLQQNPGNPRVGKNR